MSKDVEAVLRKSDVVYNIGKSERDKMYDHFDFINRCRHFNKESHLKYLPSDSKFICSNTSDVSIEVSYYHIHTPFDLIDYMVSESLKKYGLDIMQFQGNVYAVAQQNKFEMINNRNKLNRIDANYSVKLYIQDESDEALAILMGVFSEKGRI